MRSDVNLYVICSFDSLAPGEARAFSLSRVMEDGTTRPFSIFVVRSQTDQCLGYVNVCPHQGAWLNIGEGRFFTDNGQRLRCGRHKAEFEIDTGLCVKGPCRDKTIEPIALIVIDGEICLCGVDLAEEEIVDADELDETMEIMIHPG